LLIICVPLLVSSKNGTSSAKFSYSPNQPQPGDLITVSYDPSGTGLENEPAVEMVAYLYSKGQPKALGISMKKKGGKWNGSFSTEQETRGIIVKFEGENKIDNNQGNGYVIFLSDKNGNLVPGAKAGLGEAISGWGYSNVKMDNKPKVALSFLEEDFKLHPRLKREYFTPYVQRLLLIDKEEGRKAVIHELEKLSAEPDLTVEDLKNLLEWYRALNMPELFEKYTQMLRERDPEHPDIQFLEYRKCEEISIIEKKIELMEKFRREFSHEAWLLTGGIFVIDIMRAYMKNGEYKEAGELLGKNSEVVFSALYRDLASEILNKNIDITLAENMAEKAVETMQKSFELKYFRRLYLTEKENEAQRKERFSQRYALYGSILLKQGKYEKAFENLGKALLLKSERDAALSEQYAEALVAIRPPEEALDQLEKIIVSGTNTSKIRGLLRESYLKARRNGSGFADYMSKLEKSWFERMKVEIQKRLIESPAPEFALEDLDGVKIALSDLKGKVVVLDFWATWCVPCIESFPGMKTALEKFQDAGDVQFLFIDTMETVNDKKQNVINFQKKHSLPFHILLDDKREVARAFEVVSIPTKIVIDKYGKIRYRSEGFDGSAENLATELSFVIELLK